jgi:Fur family ferric uptake transcriptional regulator
MAHPHSAPPDSLKPAPRELASRLRQRGLRMTPQRERVMAAVTQLVHATPDQVAEAVPEVDLTTVYRTLEVLEQIGMLAHTHLGHGAPSYRLAEDDHIHVVCHQCSSVVDAPADLADELASRLLAERGFVLDRSHFTVFGTCADCEAGRARTEGTAAGGEE